MHRISIFFSRVTYKPQMTLFRSLSRDGFADDVKQVISPDVVTTRYGRTWRLSQPKIIEDNYFVGKLGFISSATEKKTYYDEKQKDFIEQAIDSRQGHFVQWAIDLSTQMIAFETKPPDIRFQSFVGAFKDLLDERSDIGLTLEQILESAKFFEWVKKLDRISKFTASMRAPNPDFASRPQIVIELLEKTNADSAKVELKSGRSLNTENTIHDLVEYGEDGYSTIVAHGEKNGQQRIFDSRRKIVTEQVDIPTTLPLNVDMIWNRIINALRRFRK